MECPKCKSDRVNKNGRKKGKQNYICINCRKQFIDSYERRGYGQEIKEKCLNMYASGMSFRAIQRIEGVHHTTIINWCKQLEASSPEGDNSQLIPEDEGSSRKLMTNKKTSLHAETR